ncbi:hypothetical protein [Paenibacillus ehimensis]|uniref:TniQ protein n=1 Tax=Paenibacillus ehimensis TaxID=79264 RepID=A0ABT8VFK9_9BACL|nr:hypothetical protein [Paenibacillus ehimensis]MDO3679738.1 hypothetical protein [Paenibacillus ehimensis]
MIFLEPYKKVDTIPSITWDLNWISEWESPWSIFEKIKFANLAVKKDIFTVFGNEKVLSLRSILGKKNHDLYGLYAFDDDAFMNSIGFRLKQYNIDCLLDISGFLYKNDIQRDHLKGKAAIKPYKYFRSNLHFCLECMKSGYHSILYQFKMISHCPYHSTVLHSACPQCHTMIPYELSDKFFQAPFVCNCDYSFMEYNTPYHRDWGKVRLDHVRDQAIYQWLTLNQEEKLCLSRVHFYSRNDLKKIPSLLNFLLGIIHKHSTGDEGANLKRSSSPIIQKADRYLKNVSVVGNVKMMPIENWFDLEQHQRHSTISRVISELASSSTLTMKSISKYLRKTLLTKHKSCIRRFVRISKEKGADHPPICPFAYAYVMWKKSLWGIPKYYDVEDTFFYRDGSPLRQISSECDHDYIVDLLDTWIQLHPIKTPFDLASLEWMINKAIGHLALLHFKTWLRKAPTYAASFRIAYHSEIMEDEIPVFAFSFPNASDLPISFICMPGDDELNWLKEADHIICPYPSVKRRRKKPTEISHHPMRLAMEKINEADRC